MSAYARKRFGQHFLHDPHVIRKALDAIAPAPDDNVVEIGPGRGALTRPLLERLEKLSVIEIDTDLAAQLVRNSAAGPRLTVYAEDALEFDFSALAGADRRLRVVGNLPYNVSTPLLFHLLKFRADIEDIHVMLQKEVVDRMTAVPGNKDYGRLTVMLSAWTDIEACFDVGPGAFSPPPKVRSTFVRIRPRSAPRFEVADELRFARLVAHLFSMRRKTIARALKGRVGAEQIAALGIDPRARPETLLPDEFERLAAFDGAARSDERNE
jgi:16S rRNA (adenine1518-N6/adenine1519-N6)-dimethyltransferase